MSKRLIATKGDLDYVSQAQALVDSCVAKKGSEEAAQWWLANLVSIAPSLDEANQGTRSALAHNDFDPNCSEVRVAVVRYKLMSEGWHKVLVELHHCCVDGKGPLILSHEWRRLHMNGKWGRKKPKNWPKDVWRRNPA